MNSKDKNEDKEVSKIDIEESKKAKILDIDDYEQDITLYNLISPGTGKAMLHLKDITDCYHNSKPDKFSVLITGSVSKRTHALALARALGCFDIIETPWKLIDHHIGVGKMMKISNDSTSHIITDINPVFSTGSINEELYTLINKGFIDVYVEYGQKRRFKINSPVILTARNEKDIPDYLLGKLTHKIKISEIYLDSQIADIIRRRLEYCNIDYDKVIPAGLAKVFKNDLRRIIDVLKSCITVMRARGDSKLQEKHVKRALMYI